MDTTSPPAPAPVRSRRRRRWWWIGGSVLVAVLGVAYASASGGARDVPRPPKAFCVAAYRYERELDRQVANGTRDLERQTELVAAMDAAAPRAIRDETHAFLRAMRHVQSDPSVRDRPSVRAAVDAVNRYATQGCKLLEQDRQP